MPEDNLYSAYLAGGEAEGAYASGIREMEDTWSALDYNQRLATARQDKLSRGVDIIGAGLELGSTVYGGWQDKRKFEGESLPAAQQMIAKKSYKPEEHGGVKWEEFQKGDKYQDYLSKFAPKKIKMSVLDSLFADQASYTIGEEKFKKSDISLMGKFAGSERLAKILGTDPSTVVDLQSSMYDESQDVNENIQEISESIVNIPKVDKQTVLSTSKQTVAKSNKLGDIWDYLSGSGLETDLENVEENVY